MKYVDYRSQIKTGDILVWSKRKVSSFKDLLAWFVRFFTRSEYNHVGMAWVYNDRVFILEAVIPLIRIVPLSNCLPCYVISMDMALSKKAEDAAFELIGSGEYSVSEAIKAYFGANSTESKWQCVEYVKEILRKNEIHILGKDTPTDFVLELQKLGKNTIYIT